MRSSHCLSDRRLRFALLLVTGLGVGPRLHAQVTVRSVEPAELTIESGGPAGEFVVVGAGLDQVQRIEITRSGRVVNGVDGRVSRARAAELVLTVTAAANVGSTTDLRVVLVTLRERVELRATLAVTAPPPPPSPPTPPPPPDPPPPILHAAGAFLVTVAQLALAAPPDPISLVAGAFLVTVAAPVVAMQPPEPITATAGTFVVTIAAPSPGGD